MSDYHCFSKTERKAAKPHRCIWCGEAIAQGARYFDERSAYEGRIQRHHWHPECLQSAEDGWRDGDDAEFMPYSNARPELDSAQSPA